MECYILTLKILDQENTNSDLKSDDFKKCFKYLKNRHKSVDISICLRIIAPQGHRPPLWCLCWSPRNDKPLIWSDPEGSSHSGGLVCRGAAGRGATLNLF